MMQLPEMNLSHPILAKLASGEAEDRTKTAAVKGLLPLEPSDFARALFIMSRDISKELRMVLKETIDGYDDDYLSLLVAQEDLEPPVLHFLGAACSLRRRIVEEIILNPRTAVETILFFIARSDGDLLELISVNEERLIASEKIVEAMLLNPQITPRVRLRLKEIQIRHFNYKVESDELRYLEKQKDEQEKQELKEALEAPTTEKEIEIVKQAVRTKAVLKGDKVTDDLEIKDEDLSLYQRIKNMNTGQKIREAILGGKGSRILLVMDSNKSVQRAVLKSPKITDPEVELLANNRNIPSELLAAISKKKGWMKNYGVTSGLVKNPKTPPHIAVNLVGNLTNRDLNLLKSDKQVPDVIRKQAGFVLQRKSR